MKAFIPIECDILFDDRMSALINKMGATGYGVYMILLIELRNRKDYCMDTETLKLIMRKYNVKRKLMEEVLYNYDLFTVERVENDSVLITSDYVTRIMQNYNNKVTLCSISGKKGADKRWQKKDGDPIATEQNREEQNRTEEKEEKEKPVAAHWSGYLTEAFNDRSWLECQAKHSGLGIRFVKYEKDIAGIFVNHVVTHGKGHGLLSVNDVKYYFANFVRQGTATCKRITEELDRLEEVEKANNPYPFETIDPANGQRTYFGKIIPAEAPPRPNNNAVWVEEMQKWM